MEVMLFLLPISTPGVAGAPPSNFGEICLPEDKASGVMPPHSKASQELRPSVYRKKNRCAPSALCAWVPV